MPIHVCLGSSFELTDMQSLTSRTSYFDPVSNLAIRIRTDTDNFHLLLGILVPTMVALVFLCLSVLWLCCNESGRLLFEKLKVIDVVSRLRSYHPNRKPSSKCGGNLTIAMVCIMAIAVAGSIRDYLLAQTVSVRYTSEIITGALTNQEPLQARVSFLSCPESDCGGEVLLHDVSCSGGVQSAFIFSSDSCTKAFCF